MEADFSDANLAEADLTSAYLIKSNLSGANLSEADLTDVVLAEATLKGADFRDAELMGAWLNGADLTGAVNLTADQIEDANIDRDTRLPEYLKLAWNDDGSYSWAKK